MAGPLDGEETGLRTHHAGAVAGGAGLGCRARLGARTFADFTGDGSGNTHLRGLARIGLGQVDLEIVAQVRTARGTTPAAAGALAASTSAAHEVAEQVLEDIGHGGTEFRPEARATAGPAPAFKGLVAKAVIGSTLLRVLEDIIGLVHFLELGLGLLGAGIGIGVKLFGLVPEGRLQRLFIGAFLHTQNFIIVALGHRLRLTRKARTLRGRCRGVPGQGP